MCSCWSNYCWEVIIYSTLVLPLWYRSADSRVSPSQTGQCSVGRRKAELSAGSQTGRCSRRVVWGRRIAPRHLRCMWVSAGLATSRLLHGTDRVVDVVSALQPHSLSKRDHSDVIVWRMTSLRWFSSPNLYANFYRSLTFTLMETFTVTLHHNFVHVTIH